MKQENTHVIIMAGGIGSRFWPLSTPEYPKQFIDVMGTGRTLIQMTYDRFAPICESSHIWVVTNRDFIPIVREQLPLLPEDNILSEPVARNTAPCIAYAGWKIAQRHPEANIVVTPADALVTETEVFRHIIGEALEFTQDRDAIVTVGIRPTRPETGFGYVKMLLPAVSGGIHKVARFCEKPALEMAREYLADGNYLWNAGIFVWKVSTLMESIRRYAGGIAGIMEEMAVSFYTDREEEAVGRFFPMCEKISIDYAVMEKHPEVYTIPGSFGWSDLGNWASLHGLLVHDSRNNASVGNVEFHDCTGCVVHAAEASRVVVQGLDGYIVSEKNGQLLICKLSEEQRIKEFSAARKEKM